MAVITESCPFDCLESSPYRVSLETLDVRHQNELSAKEGNTLLIDTALNTDHICAQLQASVATQIRRPVLYGQ
jgi:hypothetical protein